MKYVVIFAISITAIVALGIDHMDRYEKRAPEVAERMEWRRLAGPIPKVGHVANYLKPRMKDPRSLRDLNCGKTYFVAEPAPHWEITCSYSGKNSFGAYTNTTTTFVSVDGKLTPTDR